MDTDSTSLHLTFAESMRLQDSLAEPYRPSRRLYSYSGESRTLYWVSTSTAESWKITLPLLKNSCALAELPDSSLVFTGGFSASPLAEVWQVYPGRDFVGIRKPDMTYARDEHRSVYLCGFVYVLFGNCQDTSERFNLATQVWEVIPGVRRVHDFTAVALNSTSEVGVFGGYDASMRANPILIFSPLTFTWRDIWIPHSCANPACFKLGTDSETVYFTSSYDNLKMKSGLYAFKAKESRVWAVCEIDVDPHSYGGESCYIGGVLYCSQKNWGIEGFGIGIFDI